jgi:hypothetical protein
MKSDGSTKQSVYTPTVQNSGSMIDGRAASITTSLQIEGCSDDEGDGDRIYAYLHCGYPLQ